LQATQAQLEKEQKLDTLDKKMAARPTQDHLIEKNIIQK